MRQTVAEFAELLKVPVDRLMHQLDQVGMSKSDPSDLICEDEQRELLSHLRRSHSTELRPVHKRRYSDDEQRSSRAWGTAGAEQEEAEKKIVVGRTFDPSENDGDLNPDSDSDRF